jgi:hypothetical protein
MPFRPHLYHSLPSRNFPDQLPQPAITKLLPSEYPISWCKILVYLFSRSGVLIMLLFICVSPFHFFNYFNRSRILTLLTCQSCFPCCRSVYTISVCFVVSLYAYDESVIPWLPSFLHFFLQLIYLLSLSRVPVLEKTSHPILFTLLNFVVFSRYLISDLLKARSCPHGQIISFSILFVNKDFGCLNSRARRLYEGIET